jgi:hypothetical protein
MKTSLEELGPIEIHTYFGLLAAMAHADGHLDEAEVALFDCLRRIHGSSEKPATLINVRIDAPPPPKEIATRLQGSDARFTLYLDAALMARSDGTVSDEEVWLLNDLQERLDITQDQAVALCNLSIAVILCAEERPSRAHAERLLVAAEARVICEDIPSSSVCHVRRFVQSAP